MKKILSIHSVSLKQKDTLKSWLFFLPLLFGLAFFFLIPIAKSFLFSVSTVTSGADGYKIQLAGFSSYYKAFFVNNDYRQTVILSARSVLGKTPLIILFSFFMASVLNQNFRGKTLFRVILFLPLVLTIMNIQSISLESSMSAAADYKDTGINAASFTAQINEMLLQAGMSEDLTTRLTGMADGVYNIIGESSIQILIILVGMQAISPSLYEAATVEGATAWENFWKITFPMVSPMIVTCIIYTIIDSFTSTDNGVITLISATADKLDFSLASAMGWVYFLMIAILLAIIGFISSRLVISADS